jgi:hypothetical protein
MRRFALITAGGVVLAAGCGESATSHVYLLDGKLTPLGPRGQLVAVERTDVEQPADLLAALLRGPRPEEVRRGIVTTIPEHVGVASIRVTNGTAVVDFTGSRADPTFLGSTVDGAAQVIYTLTSLPGIRRVALRHEGKPCCMYRHDGSAIAEPHTRRDFKGWGGEPCEFRETPAPSCSTP